MKKLNYLFLAVILLASCAQNNKDVTKTNQSADLDSLFSQYFEERLKYYPLEATAIADNRYNDQLPIDISESYRETLKGFYRKYADAIEKFDRSQLKGQDVLSYDVFKREMAIQLEGLGFKNHLMPLNQFWSMHLTFPKLGSGSSNQPFKTVKDYDDFLKRIDAFVAYEDTAIANMKRGMAEKITPPAILMERVLPQLKDMIVDDPAKSVFYGPVKSMPSSFSDEDKKRLTEAYTKSIAEKIVPVYKRLHDFISGEYMQSCYKTVGISEVPGGKEYYNYMTKYWTTTDLTPDEIFNLGEQEVARIKSEMEKVKDQVGFKGDLKSFIISLQTDKKMMPYKTDQEVLDGYNAIHKRMEPQLKKLFNMVPETKFEIRQTEEFREATASAEYEPGAPDGTRPGIFYVPIIDPTKFNVMQMEDLFLHEAIPGHHYQISIQYENEQLPKFRRYSWHGAYGEGWALYSEALGKELGLYEDLYQYFGSLSAEMHRAIRLVVDVGMHMKGWTREQAIAFSLDKDTDTEKDITIEIERYMAIPGQALAYKVGQLKIIEIRKRAESELAEKFNIGKFHDEVLINGCLPLDVFERNMNEWIREQKGNS